MGSKTEDEEEEVLSKMSMPTPGRRLRELPYPSLSSPARSGMQTPPFHPPAAVPFRWEQEPGKPWPCSALVILPEDFTFRSPGLPPGLPAPPTLPHGSRLQAPSFRMGGECRGSSFRGLDGEEDPVCKKRRWRRLAGAARFGLWTGRGKHGIDGKADVVGSMRYVFPSWDWSFEGEENGGRRMMTLRSRSSSSSFSRFPILPHPKSHFWVSENTDASSSSLVSSSQFTYP